ncbi:MAG: hypothetical protein KKC84_05160 [Candidatus Omnitrophica bacterium]|nr:hypothetical protein [Candidatus Omnitrophota bacterium]
MGKVLSPREKRIFILTVGLFIFSVCFHFFLGPFLNRFERAVKKISVTRVRLKKSFQLLSRKEELETRFQEMARTQPASSAKDQDPYIATLTELENLARDSGIRIIDIRPHTVRGSNQKEIGADIRTEGSLEGLVRFLYRVENSFSLLQVKKMQVSSKANSQLLEGNFSILKLSIE